MTELDRLRSRLEPAPEGRCLLGLSGGADSVALLQLLLPLRGEKGFELEAVHVNHGLRADASDGDEAFVREMCAALGVPLWTARPDLGGARDENRAREARYAAFREILEARGIPTLILAHQRDDQAETFLMRLLRGAGPGGLSAMRAAETREGYRILRPMLAISGAELRAALRAEGIPWREDGSNQDRSYFRNRVRLELIPLMEEMAPGAAGRIARSAGLVASEQDALTEAARRMLEAAETGKGLELRELREAPEALRRSAVRLWWRKNGPELRERELSYEQTRRLTELMDAPRGTIINLPGGWRARREQTCLRLLDPENRTKNNRPAREERKKHD